MKKKLSFRHAAIAYVLNIEMGYSQSEISQLMKVSQSTISNKIKDFTIQKQMEQLQEELEEARKIIQEHNLLPQNVIYFPNNE